MPKIKTKRAAYKRFKISGTGKIKRKRTNKRHILTGKSPKRKRQLRLTGYADATNVRAIKRMLPNCG